MITFSGLLPLIIVPAIITLSPVETTPRVEIFASSESAAAIKIVNFHHTDARCLH